MGSHLGVGAGPARNQGQIQGQLEQVEPGREEPSSGLILAIGLLPLDVLEASQV